MTLPLAAAGMDWPGAIAQNNINAQAHMDARTIRQSLVPPYSPVIIRSSKTTPCTGLLRVQRVAVVAEYLVGRGVARGRPVRYVFGLTKWKETCRMEMANVER